METDSNCVLVAGDRYSDAIQYRFTRASPSAPKVLARIETKVNSIAVIYFFFKNNVCYR